MSLLKPFFKLDLIFSGDLIKQKTLLKKELFDCHQYMNYSHTELEKMPVYVRKYYIDLHNKRVEKEKEEIERNKQIAKRKKH